MQNNTRGEQKLCSITYSQIAEWSGLSLHSVRAYARRGQFDRHSLESVLQWVNARRQRQGLPMIGQPGEAITEPPVPINTEPVTSGGYDPLTGSY